LEIFLHEETEDIRQKLTQHLQKAFLKNILPIKYTAEEMWEDRRDGVKNEARTGKCLILGVMKRRNEG
jgi:hypothetical protein